ncbi:hypothetical protein U14_04367 [Candidatus Moduliflexus flocculans]|uniref:YCII-related domain-containing protein n=1 Tax=Candidatus Moduliflexus flocculans TaxID=1499966 RepID=A0A0S6W4Q5_9BACT|nr:hypothetical protein U14_04367 [Candidatus Moduliflexus flocculans]
MEIFEAIQQKMAIAKPYITVILRKGEQYDTPDTQEFLMTQHVPYLFKLRLEGLLNITVAASGTADIKGVAIYNLTDIEQVKQLTENDPAIRAEKLCYDIMPCFGFPGDVLL